MSTTTPRLANPLPGNNKASWRYNDATNVAELYFDNSMIDPRDFGVLGDGTTDDTAAVQACFDAAPPGSTIDFTWLTAQVRFSAPLRPREQTRIRGPWRGMWPYRYSTPHPGSFRALAGFSGLAGFLLQEKTLTGRTLDEDGIELDGIFVDMSSASGNLDCFRVEGLCRDLVFRHCVGALARGTGRSFHMLTGSGTVNPRGIRMEHCTAWSSQDMGFRFNGVTDFSFYDLLAVSCSQRGFYHSNPGAGTYVSCHSVFNTFEGFYIDGTTTSGLFSMVGCHTDRNGRSGLRIVQSGTQPITINGCEFRRDGSSSTSSNYAGILIDGAAGIPAVPVEIVGCLVAPGVDDGGGGSQTPQHAVRASYAQRVNIVGGEFHGISSGFSDGGNNTIVEWTPETYWASGAIGSKARVTPSKIGPSELLAGRTMSDVGTPASGDLIVLQDVSDSSKLKVAQFSTFGGGGGGSVAGGADHLALITIGVS